MSDNTFDYNTHVKKNLNNWREKFEKDNNVTLNYSAIKNALETHFNIKTSIQKIAVMFNPGDPREIKLKELVAIAQIFDIPLWDICQYPNNPCSEINSWQLTRNKKESSSPIHELHNNYYFTEKGKYYYCYYFRPKHFQNRIKPVEDLSIEEAKMSIFLQNGHTMVKFEEVKSSTTFYGEKMPSFTLSGKLYHFENTNMAYSFISDSSGRRAMALMFSFLNLSADIRYYMTVGMMTFSLNQTHEPLFQKMAVFRVKQNYQEEYISEMLRGILALNSSPLIIDEETKKKLEEDDVMRNLLSEGSHPEKYYLYNEATLRDLYLIPDDYQRMQMLLQLRKNSLYPAHEIVSESDTFADFIKRYQLQQLQEHKNDNER